MLDVPRPTNALPVEQLRAESDVMRTLRVWECRGFGSRDDEGDEFLSPYTGLCRSCTEQRKQQSLGRSPEASDLVKN